MGGNLHTKLMIIPLVWAGPSCREGSKGGGGGGGGVGSVFQTFFMHPMFVMTLIAKIEPHCKCLLVSSIIIYTQKAYTHTHTHTHTHIRTYTDTHIHTNTHIHTVDMLNFY